MDNYKSNINNGIYEYTFETYNDNLFNVAIKQIGTNQQIFIDIIGIKIKNLAEKLRLFFENYLSQNSLKTLPSYISTNPKIEINHLSFNFSSVDMKIY